VKTLLKMTGLGINALASVSPRLAGWVGLRLFCRPFRSPLRASHRRFFDSAESFSFSSGGHTVRAYRWGSGTRKLLLLHGWQSHSYYWKGYVEAFSKEKYTLYSFDAPGHGLSGGHFLSVPLYAGLIHAFIRQQGPFEAAIGHSLGSFSLLYAWYRHAPLPVNKVVVLASPGNADEFFAAYQQTLRLSDRGLRSTIRRFEDAFGQPPSGFSAARFAAAVRVPGLILHDEHDSETPLRNAQVLHQSWPQSTLSVTKGLGHPLKSAAVLDQVSAFVAGD
jgi:pimeloyl-ACP methyl ester carboxylesterase